MRRNLLMAEAMLSSEDIRRFEQTLSRFDKSLDRQEEIVEKILASEKDIGETRISYLNRFFDTYSSRLDDFVARKSSKLSDAYLIMDGITGDNSNKRNIGGGTSTANNYRRNAGDGGGTPPKPPKANTTGGSGGDDGSISPKQVISEDSLALLGESAVTSENIVERLESFQQKYKTLEEQLKAIEEEQSDAPISKSQLDAASAKAREDLRLAYAEQESNLEKKYTELKLAQTRTAEDVDSQIRSIQLSRATGAVDAAIRAQTEKNNLDAEIEYYAKNYDIAGELRAQEVQASIDERAARELRDRMASYEAKRELEEKRKNNGILTKEASARIKKELSEKFSLEKLNDEKRVKNRIKLELEEEAKKQSQQRKDDLDNLLGKGHSLAERKEALYNLTHDESGEADKGTILATAVQALDKGIKSISDYAAKLESQVDEIGSYKGDIDTRLRGSSNETYNGSYWDQLVKDMTSIGAINPYYKQADFAANIRELVDSGIAFDLEQRAFLMTISDKIATTFKATDGTLMRLVRIQQQDSTAGRLGMEAALNAFLNNMYENTEYLKTVADGVRGSLEEMQALMEGAEATEVEYQVQKWLGSLYSVGMSQNAVNSISNALGQIAAGQIEGLTSGGAGNLLVMAANDAGLSIADILTDGINASDTNKLLQASVNYLAQLADSAKDNKVVQQQLAEVFGVKASDLRAASNLVLPGSVNSIFDYSTGSTYEDMIAQLLGLAGSMGSRTSIAQQMTNIWENVQYSLAGSMASSPIAYFIYKVASALDSTTGGISIPAISVMGNMVDLETTVADLLRVGALSGSILGSIGDLASGLSNSFNGQAMLAELGITKESGLRVTPRGVSASESGGASLSESGGYVGMVGNTASSDVQAATMQSANDTKKQAMIEAQEEAEANQIDILNNTVLKIYELLDEVVNGNGSVRVKVEGYGLTKSNSSGSMGGVAGLSGSGGYSGSGVNSTSVTSNIDLGGWIMV